MFKRVRHYLRILSNLENNVRLVQESLGRIELNQKLALASSKLSDNEFRIHSQWGEDGILQFLIHALNIQNKTFIEFGVENYLQANTRFWLVNNNWTGLVIDGEKNHIDQIKDDPIYWQYNLTAKCNFIDKDNINELICDAGFFGDIGILSIDIDGNDYWVWDAINIVSPLIVVVEYNARFPLDMSVTVPYDPLFVRGLAHPSNIYYGASLSALYGLGQRKGYAFIGCNSAGNNAFFVRRDILNSKVIEVSPEDGYRINQFRESRSINGKLKFLKKEEELKILVNLPLVEVEK